MTGIGLKSLVWIALSLTCLFALQNCKDPEPPSYECIEDITVRLPEKLVSTFFFKKGSYWIYQREDSLYTDSVWVTENREGVYPVDRKQYSYFTGQKCYESRSTQISSLHGFFYTTNKYSIHERAPKETSSYSEELFVLYDGWQQTSQIRLGLSGIEFSTINAFGDSVRHTDSLQVQGALYHDIIVYTKKANVPDYLKEAYYAPGFGMIKFKDKHNIWWNLIRSHIVQ